MIGPVWSMSPVSSDRGTVESDPAWPAPTRSSPTSLSPANSSTTSSSKVGSASVGSGLVDSGSGLVDSGSRLVDSGSGLVDSDWIGSDSASTGSASTGSATTGVLPDCSSKIACAVTICAVVITLIEFVRVIEPSALRMSSGTGRPAASASARRARSSLRVIVCSTRTPWRDASARAGVGVSDRAVASVGAVPLGAAGSSVIAASSVGTDSPVVAGSPVAANSSVDAGASVLVDAGASVLVDAGASVAASSTGRPAVDGGTKLARRDARGAKAWSAATPGASASTIATASRSAAALSAIPRAVRLADVTVVNDARRPSGRTGADPSESGLASAVSGTSGASSTGSHWTRRPPPPSRGVVPVAGLSSSDGSRADAAASTVDKEGPVARRFFRTSRRLSGGLSCHAVMTYSDTNGVWRCTERHRLGPNTTQGNPCSPGCGNRWRRSPVRAPRASLRCARANQKR